MKRLGLILTLFLALPATAGRSFNGSSSLIVANGDGTALDISSGPETISLWFNAATVDANQRTILSNWTGGSGSQFIICLYNCIVSGTAVANSVQWSIGCCGGLGVPSGYCGGVSANTWYNVVIWLNPPSYGSQLNGVACTTAGIYQAERSSPGTSVVFGGRPSMPQYAGSIAEVAIWNQQLPVSAMTALATICPVGPSARRMGFPKPVGYFPLWGASGTSLEPDFSGNANSGTITAATPSNHAPCTP